jgi:hypothetical protein
MELSKFATSVEKKFNIAAGIPIVALPSSLLRILAAKVQITASFTIGCVSLIAGLVHSDPKWNQMTHTAFEHWLHGQLNAYRAVGEFFTGLTIVGSPILLVTQAASRNKFNPLISYSESTPEKTTPEPAKA